MSALARGRAGRRRQRSRHDCRRQRQQQPSGERYSCRLLLFVPAQVAVIADPFCLSAHARVHSPDEQVLVPTVEPFWRATLEILHQLARRRA